MAPDLIAHVDAAARVLDVPRSTVGRAALRAYLAALPEPTRAAIAAELKRAEGT
jgi:DNA-binding transcriptional ArsR family regulator